MSGIIAQNTLDNSGLIKAPAGGGAWNFISKQTASASADISFTSGIDSTYKEYVFTLNNIHPSDNSGGGDENVTFQGNAAGGSGYNETITSTVFAAYHNEADDNEGLGYEGGQDQAQGTAFQSLGYDYSYDADHAGCGYLHLFNPSSTTFVKHFLARISYTHHADNAMDFYVAGYFNTTSAIDEIQFKMTSGNIDAGDICLYGISS